MKKLIIVCEGPTEQEFVRAIIEPHFLPKEIYTPCPLIKKSRGGIVPWKTLKSQIQYHLRESNTIVTTLIDYYGIPDSYDFPGWQESKRIADKTKRMEFLEDKMLEDIDTNLSPCFVPYFQLHEFEGLLFNNLEAFESTFEPEEFIDKKELIHILSQYQNPELMNDNPATAPSKRLEKLIKGYKKVVYGSMLAENIGLYNLRKKSPRFNNWLDRLENSCNKI